MLLKEIRHQFMEKCRHRKLEIDENFANFLIQILAKDERNGLKVSDNNQCKLNRFLHQVILKYADPLDVTMCNLKLSHFFFNWKEMDLEYVRTKHKLFFNTKLQHLIDDILQYPETSSRDQTDEMFYKMQVFVVVCYNIGSPSNEVLLQHVGRSLRSVLGYKDLQNYVSKKKYHRFEYIQRLSSTVCGILIYNNHGEKENMRDILSDLTVAQAYTDRYLKMSLDRITTHKNYGSSVLQNVVHINVNQRTVSYQCSIEKVREINKFVILFAVNERCLQKLRRKFEHTKYLISVNENKLKCVIEKINDSLKLRTAVESRLIFPHFMFLSEVWTTLILYFNYLAEINKINDQMCSYVSEELESKFIEALEYVRCENLQIKSPIKRTFGESIEYQSMRTEPKTFKKNIHIKDYCCLTIAITNGIVVPSAYIQKEMCVNLDYQFGFSNIDFAKYTEKNFEELYKAFISLVYKSADLILLFNLQNEVFQPDFGTEKSGHSSRKDSNTQTEVDIMNDLSGENKLGGAWNMWDFHRESTRIANLRKRQTHSIQTLLSYGQNIAENQSNNTKGHS